MITMKELRNHPREIPVINLFDVTSLESWRNLSCIVFANTRRVDVIKDIAVTLHGFVLILMLILMILDAFGAFWDKFSLIFNPSFITIITIDGLVITFIVFRSLWFKV